MNKSLDEYTKIKRIINQKIENFLEVEFRKIADDLTDCDVKIMSISNYGPAFEPRAGEHIFKNTGIIDYKWHIVIEKNRNKDNVK